VASYHGRALEKSINHFFLRNELSKLNGSKSLTESTIRILFLPTIIIRMRLVKRFSVSSKACRHEPHGVTGSSVMPEPVLATIDRQAIGISGKLEI
jgi:hypothetical protein